MSSLSTHVLNTVSGRPASAVQIRLFAGDTLMFTGLTNADGRCAELRSLELKSGKYRLEFEIGAYFQQQGMNLPEPLFLDVVPIVFGLGEAMHAHVPLLAAPYGYSTYRGS